MGVPHVQGTWRWGNKALVVVVVLPDPFRGMGARRNSAKTQQSGHTPSLDHRSRIEREEPKIDLRRGSEAGQWREEMIEVL